MGSPCRIIGARTLVFYATRSKQVSSFQALGARPEPEGSSTVGPAVATPGMPVADLVSPGRKHRPTPFCGSGASRDRSGGDRDTVPDRGEGPPFPTRMAGAARSHTFSAIGP